LNVTRIKELEDQVASAMSEHTRRLNEAEVKYPNLKREKTASDQIYRDEINRSIDSRES